MTKKPGFITLCMLICLAFVFTQVRRVVIASPMLPADFWGIVQVNGRNVPEGTQVSALINGMPVAQTETILYEGLSMYSIVVPGDDPSTSVVEGGTQGAEVEFRVDGKPADQTGIWLSGTSAEVDLTVTTRTPPTMTLVSTPLPTQPLITQVTSLPDASPTPSLSKTQVEPVPLVEPSPTDQHSFPTQTDTMQMTDEVDPGLTIFDTVASPRIEESESQLDSVQAENMRNPVTSLTLISLVIGIAFAAFLIFEKLRR